MKFNYSSIPPVACFRKLVSQIVQEKLHNESEKQIYIALKSIPFHARSAARRWENTSLLNRAWTTS